MRLPFILGLATLALPSIATAQQIAGARTGRSHHDVQPFYLEQAERAGNVDGGARTDNVSRWVIAKKADGTTVRSEARGPDPEHRLRRRNIYYADEHYVTVYDALKLKTTWPVTPSGHADWRRIEDDASDVCARRDLDDDGQPLESVNGLESVEGQIVVVTTATRADYRFVSWRAPRLGCEELYYRAEKLQADASPIITLERNTTKLVVGDPDPQLFAIPSDYVETKPSEALMKAVLAMGLPISDAVRQQLVDEGVEADKRYRGEQ